MTIWDIVEKVVLWALTALLGALFTHFKMKYEKVKKEDEALRIGMQSLLRSNIIQLHDKYTEKGYCPIYGKEAIEKEYESYHALGGNGVVTKLYNDIMALPEEKPKAKSKTKNTSI